MSTGISRLSARTSTMSGRADIARREPPSSMYVVRCATCSAPKRVGTSISIGAPTSDARSYPESAENC